MLLDFRGNLRGTCGNRPDIKFMKISLIKLTVDGICTASVALGDPWNDTQNHYFFDFSSINFVQFRGLRASVKYTTKN